MRYLVVGTSGAGKSTFAQQLAAQTQSPYLELDSLYWGPDWQAVPTERFRHLVVQATQAERWVADGNYSAVRDILWPQASHVVWLNYSRLTVFSRLLWRTLRHSITRQRLSHGNRESLAMALFSKDSILLWALTTYAKNQRKFAALRNDPQFAHLQWVEVRKPSEAAQVLQAIAASPKRLGSAALASADATRHCPTESPKT